MNYRIGCDAHKHYSQFAFRIRMGNSASRPGSITSPAPSTLPGALAQRHSCRPGERRQLVLDRRRDRSRRLPALLTNPAKAKLMMGHVNKTDKLDANGLGDLLRLGSLPSVWLPPAALRDQRELPRTRMALAALRTSLKNRIHSMLAKYGISSPEAERRSSPAQAEPGSRQPCPELPPETRRCLSPRSSSARLPAACRSLSWRIASDCAIALDPHHAAAEEPSRRRGHPGHRHRAGDGHHRSLLHARQFTSYAGLAHPSTPPVGRLATATCANQSNQYLKWAFIEAANVVVRHRHHPAWKTKYVCQVYDQVCQRKGHSIAVGAVARHLAEAAFWILKSRQPTGRLPTGRPLPSRCKGAPNLYPQRYVS